MNWRLMANLAGFQLGWFACVLGGSEVGLAVVAVLMAAHLRWLARPGEWRWLAGFAVAGLVIDGGLVLAGGFGFTSSDLRLGPLPLWLWLLWPLFGGVVQHGLAWLWRHPWLAMLCGATGAPLSYYTGARLAGVSLAPWLLIAEALVWLLLCRWLCHRLGGRVRPLRSSH
ncbi:DUF2878 domain-containing protein [Halomonas sp. I1]|uniref:DUF2878 domain-containing protein n=1 Tax=Halomonas sp. I1 TaxID=393536 RepID=UPI0028DFDAD9|nr:DUF2878 domain-containing protein [Halomonas sp. I1]MDT8894806.1 DUF2878 domain-containing protein [Halomonas sp. I1]